MTTITVYDTGEGHKVEWDSVSGAVRVLPDGHWLTPGGRQAGADLAPSNLARQIDRIPVRTELLGGQRTSYIQKDEVMALLEDVPQPAAERTCEVPTDWSGYEALSDSPDVHKALESSSCDPAGDGGVMVVRAICEALRHREG